MKRIWVSALFLSFLFMGCAKGKPVPWTSVASSRDGTKLVAVGGGYIHTSTDSGATWRKRGTWDFWTSVASSGDGTRLVATSRVNLADFHEGNGRILVSTDSGVSWTRANISQWNWLSVASSSDGSKLVVVGSGVVNTSTNSGATWTQGNWQEDWTSVASSADGTKLVAVANGGYIYTSTNSGATWTQRGVSDSWVSVASSADGSKLVAVVNGGYIFASADSGATWTWRGVSDDWASVASSTDGSKLVALTSAGHIYTSTSSGVEWTKAGGGRAGETGGVGGTGAGETGGVGGTTQTPAVAMDAAQPTDTRSADRPSDVSVDGNGGTTAGAMLTVSEPSVDLGSIDVGRSATPKMVTVSNAGTHASGPITVSVSGAGITASGCSGMTLAPTATCTISISATPVAAGAISGSVSVSEGTSAPKLILVSGIATMPGQFSLTPSSLDLGKVPPKAVATDTVVMTNQGATGLSGIVITINGTGFTLAPATTCSDTLAVGQTCDIVVSFTGTTAGPASGSIIVGQGGVTKTVMLTATVQSPAKLAMTPVTAAFTATAGLTSMPVTFYVTNSGDVVSGIPMAVLGGPNAADFSISSNSCVTALVGGAMVSCQLSVVFSPKSATATSEQAILTVTDSGPGASSATAALTGTPILPSNLALSGGPDLGTVMVGATSAAVTFTLKNTGDNASGSVTLTPSDPQFVLVTASDTCTGRNLLLKGDSCTFALQFKPAAGAVGVVTARITATGSSTAKPAVLTITGTAVPPATLVATPTLLDFGALPLLQESPPQTLTISNSGGAPTRTLSVTNTGPPFNIKSNTCYGAVLLPTGTSKSCSIIVTFTAVSTLVDAKGSVSVTDGQSTATAVLHGVGMSRD